MVQTALLSFWTHVAVHPAFRQADMEIRNGTADQSVATRGSSDQPTDVHFSEGTSRAGDAGIAVSVTPSASEPDDVAALATCAEPDQQPVTSTPAATRQVRCRRNSLMKAPSRTRSGRGR